MLVEEGPSIHLVPRQQVLHEQSHEPIEGQRRRARKASEQIVPQLSARRAAATVLLRQRADLETPAVVFVQRDKPRRLPELEPVRVRFLACLLRAAVRVLHLPRRVFDGAQEIGIDAVLRQTRGRFRPGRTVLGRGMARRLVLGDEAKPLGGDGGIVFAPAAEAASQEGASARLPLRTHVVSSQHKRPRLEEQVEVQSHVVLQAAVQRHVHPPPLRRSASAPGERTHERSLEEVLLPLGDALVRRPHVQVRTAAAAAAVIAAAIVIAAAAVAQQIIQVVRIVPAVWPSVRLVRPAIPHHTADAVLADRGVKCVRGLTQQLRCGVVAAAMNDVHRRHGHGRAHHHHRRVVHRLPRAACAGDVGCATPCAARSVTLDVVIFALVAAHVEIAVRVGPCVVLLLAHGSTRTTGGTSAAVGAVHGSGRSSGARVHACDPLHDDGRVLVVLGQRPQVRRVHRIILRVRVVVMLDPVLGECAHDLSPHRREALQPIAVRPQRLRGAARDNSAHGRPVHPVRHGLGDERHVQLRHVQVPLRCLRSAELRRRQRGNELVRLAVEREQVLEVVHRLCKGPFHVRRLQPFDLARQPADRVFVRDGELGQVTRVQCTQTLLAHTHARLAHGSPTPRATGPHLHHFDPTEAEHQAAQPRHLVAPRRLLFPCQTCALGILLEQLARLRVHGHVVHLPQLQRVLAPQRMGFVGRATVLGRRRIRAHGQALRDVVVVALDLQRFVGVVHRMYLDLELTVLYVARFHAARRAPQHRRRHELGDVVAEFLRRPRHAAVVAHELSRRHVQHRACEVVVPQMCRRTLHPLVPLQARLLQIRCAPNSPQRQELRHRQQRARRAFVDEERVVTRAALVQHRCPLSLHDLAQLLSKCREPRVRRRLRRRDRGALLLRAATIRIVCRLTAA